MVAAVVTRYLLVGEWSLWQDEETSLYFSHHIDNLFPAHFPFFFALLKSLFAITGTSVIAGRILAGTIGVLSIFLSYKLFERFLTAEVAVLGSVFVTLSLGHLFWSQSIRYYILLLVLQIAACHFFLDGLERNSIRHLLVSNVFLLLSVLTHLSGALLFPVFVVHLAVSLLTRGNDGHYRPATYLAFVLPFLAVCAVFALQYASFKASLAGLVTDTQPVSVSGLLVRLFAYFGLPTVLLGIAAPFVVSASIPRRALRFFLLLAYVPVVELIVIAKLNLVIALWYQGFIALVGFAALAAITLYSIHQRGYLGTYRVLLGGAVLAALPFLVAYYTVMHGDRPRWQDAADFLRSTANIAPASSMNPVVYSTVSGSMAFYLGSNPAETKNQALVKDLPPSPPARDGHLPQYFVFERSELPPSYAEWLKQNCAEAARFEAHTGPKDRTVWVYQCPPTSQAVVRHW